VRGIMDENRCAVIERGKITSISSEGYIVESFDREGIVSPAINGVNDREYAIGDIVYFFLFADGTGKIVCKA